MKRNLVNRGTAGSSPVPEPPVWRFGTRNRQFHSSTTEPVAGPVQVGSGTGGPKTVIVTKPSWSQNRKFQFQNGHNKRIMFNPMITTRPSAQGLTITKIPNEIFIYQTEGSPSTESYPNQTTVALKSKPNLINKIIFVHPRLFPSGGEEIEEKGRLARVCKSNLKIGIGQTCNSGQQLAAAEAGKRSFRYFLLRWLQLKWRGSRMGKGKQKSSSGGGRLLPNSIRIIGSCLRNVSANASTVASTVRSAGATVAASISAPSADHKDQVTWAGFDKLDVESSICRHVLLLGYRNGFQILDVEDASNFSELVSKRDVGRVTFLQIQPIPLKSNIGEGFKASHPLLLVVAEDETNSINHVRNNTHSATVGGDVPVVNSANSPTTVRFYSLKSHSYVHDLRFRSPVCMVRCSSRIVAVALATQIHCYDALNLENKFSVLTYPVSQMGNVGCGPMALGHRWLAYPSNNPPLLNTGHLSPKSACSSTGSIASTSPSRNSVMARYAMESGWHLAAGIVNLGDKGFQTISKYYQDLLPDGSNTQTSVSSGSMVSRPASTETDRAGLVVIKDCVSRAVISQFRAHSSPISALCFDPSGTLLVTASVNGNTINIFRIMPSTNTESPSRNHDTSSSYIHLYKLHRGIRAAVIQDICFSHYSQWVAIISSKGTCHVFVLSPFGGEVGFKVRKCEGEEPSLSPVLTPPWWSTSTLSMNSISFTPPQTMSPVVVSRIRDNTSGLLNSVNSVSGKSSVPSGALSAIFHNSIHGKGSNSLEHLLVFTPSGHVVQHQIHPSLGPQQTAGVNSSSQSQDVELSVCIQPLQWWDVRRRLEWPEREESISKIPSGRPSKEILSDESSNSNERAHWYLSNAEVQYNAGRLPVWQSPKIFFCVMSASRFRSAVFGEIEIEKIPTFQIEIKQKDLLPVFDRFHTVKSTLTAVINSLYQGDMPNQDIKRTEQSKKLLFPHSKPASLSSTESSDGGSSRRMENLIDLDHINTDKPSLNKDVKNKLPLLVSDGAFLPAVQGLSHGKLELENEKEEDEGDDMLGAMFAFSDEEVSFDLFSPFLRGTCASKQFLLDVQNNSYWFCIIFSLAAVPTWVGPNVESKEVVAEENQTRDLLSYPLYLERYINE
ncbi:uncharacterized protein [Phyllobates terribilis]|uniref:uncharacterized protein n=1 Tax=Phyllobates terribilis TaxID=111132 RepID=UPI003CCB0FF0